MPRLTENARRALVEERQAQVLAAAVRVFSEKGFDRATIQDVARQAGVSEGSIYNYFKNKNDLLVSIPGQIARPAVESLGALVFTNRTGAPPPPNVVLTEIAGAIISTFRENGHIFRILLSALPTLSMAQREKYMDQVVNVVAGALESYFATQIKQGIFRADLDPAIAARSFFGLLLPFVMLREILQLDARAFDDERIIAHSVELFLRGAMAKPSRSKRR